jgi:trimeric autotransporter adhesin
VPPGPGLPAPEPPTAGFSASCAFLGCTFTSTSTPGSEPIAWLSWNFGDGSLTGTGSPAGHTYAVAGTYTVTLTASDPNGLGDTESKTVTVAAPVPPTARLTVSCSGLSCNFADASSPGSGAISSRSWTFGDGTPAVQATSGTHTFARSGTYVIAVTVTDVYGLSSTASKTVTVAASGVSHVSYSGFTTKWSSPSGATNYWSGIITVAVHRADESPVAGAAVTGAWTGAVVKTSTCITDATGKCTLKSGTLSYGRSWVTLNVTSVLSSDAAYDSAFNHNQTGTRTTTFTLLRP